MSGKINLKGIKSSDEIKMAKNVRATKVDLLEVEVDNAPNNFSVITYEGKKIGNRRDLSALEVEGHYILQCKCEIYAPLADPKPVFGIAHNLWEAEHRLYEEAERILESEARDVGAKANNHSKYSKDSLRKLRKNR